MRAFVGIDPGLTGALAVIDDSGLKHLVDLPTMVRSKGLVKNQVNPAALRTYLQECLIDYDKPEIMVVIEYISAGAPGKKTNRASMISLGLSAGLIEGVVAARGYQHQLVDPSVWKKALKVTATKEHSRAEATRLYPEAELHQKNHHNRAEALLIAHWAQREFA